MPEFLNSGIFLCFFGQYIIMNKKTNKKIKKEATKRDKAFTPNPFDPLGMYGSTPCLPSLKRETPTQDADDL